MITLTVLVNDSLSSLDDCRERRQTKPTNSYISGMAFPRARCGRRLIAVMRRQLAPLRLPSMFAGMLTYKVPVGLSIAVPRTLKSSILNPGAPEPVPLMMMFISVKYSSAPRCWLRSKDCHSAVSALSHP